MPRPALRLRLVLVACLAHAAAAGASAQAPLRAADPWRGEIPVVFAEHATGGEVPVLLTGASLSALVVADLLTAAGSARWHNERFPGGPRKSPRRALALSLAATALPAAVGTALTFDSRHEEGALLILGGVVLGPSAGHWYAGRAGRAALTAGLRAGLAALGFAVMACCT